MSDFFTAAVAEPCREIKEDLHLLLLFRFSRPDLDSA